MVAVHKISDEFYEDSFFLIALHSSLADYAMAYTVNKFLKSSLKRFSKDLDVSEAASFPYFEWRDTMNDSYWTLITNNCQKEKISNNIDLFGDEPSFITYHLIPEYKDVDYFLKIDHDDINEIKKIVKYLFAIPAVLTAYVVDTDKLKSKNNLIF